jgi:hypothetical protein
MSMEDCRRGLNPGLKSSHKRAKNTTWLRMGVRIHTEAILSLVSNSWGKARFVQHA